MSMTKPVSMQEFEAKTGYVLKRNEFKDGEEFFYAEVCVGGRDEEGYFLIVQEGPAQGERGYI